MSPLDLVVAVPLCCMVAALMLGRAARWLILLAAPLMAGLALWLALLPPDAAYLVGQWELPLGILLRADGVARLMILTTALVIGAVGLHALAEPPEKPGHAAQAETFWPLVYLLWAGANAGFLTTDLFNLYVTLEMVSLAAVALAAMGSLAAALRYFMIALLGSLAYLLGVALIVARYDTVDVTLLAQLAEPDLATLMALGLMTAGLLIKAALFPMHGWLPPAHAAAPAPASALLSAIAVKLGFVILVRLWFEAFPAITGPAALQVLGGLGAAAVLYGSVQAMRQDRLKALVAFVKDGWETFEALAAWVKLRCWQTAKKYLIWFISTATVSVTFRHEVHHSTCLSKNRSSGLVPEAFGMGKGCIETKHNDLSIRRRP